MVAESYKPNVSPRAGRTKFSASSNFQRSRAWYSELKFFERQGFLPPQVNDKTNGGDGGNEAGLLSIW